MITIEQKKPRKIPGNTSCFISFYYNEDIIQIIKSTCDVAVYDKLTKQWEVPTSNLFKLIDKLFLYDDIKIISLKDEQIKNKKEIICNIDNFKTKPYQYLIDGINFGLNHDSWLLLDAPGLGKTLQMIYLAQELKRLGKIEHCFIVCGINTLKINWKKEIEKHSDLTCKILGERYTKKGRYYIGSIQDRLEDLKNPINEFFVITNIESLRSDKVIKELTNKKAKNKFDMIVVDEIHSCFPAGTLVATEIGNLPIEFLVRNKNKYKVLSYNEKDNYIEYKSITNTFEYDSNKLLNLQFKLDDGRIVNLKVTEEHPIFTKNRGYIAAIDLLETDIVLFDDSTISAMDVRNYKDSHTYDETAKYFNTSKRNIYKLLKLNLIAPKYFSKDGNRLRDIIDLISYLDFYNLYINLNKSTKDIADIYNISMSHAELLRKHYNIYKPRNLIEDKKIKNNLIRYNVENVTQVSEVSNKISTSLLKTLINKKSRGENINNFKFGNGKMSLAESIANNILIKYGFKYNKSITTTQIRHNFPDRHYGFNYKPDFYNDALKIAIEIDGSSHKKPKQKSLDRKKEECLSYLGIATFRFSNDFVTDSTDLFIDEIKKICLKED